MRLFIAFGVSEEAKEELKRLQKEFGDFGNIRFVKDFHCTLKFFGNVSDKEKNEVVESLDNLKFEPFEVCLDKVGVFPSEKFARVLWVGLKGDVNSLKENVDNCLSETFEKEDDFHSHITLGRIKKLKDKEGFLKFLKEVEVRKICFNIEKVELIKNELTKEGSVYEVIKEI